MSSLSGLPADQRAVLELVLQRGRSYDEIARLLSIDRAAVRQRALSALDALGPQTPLPQERRALITDYLLGQLPEAVAEQAREHLAQSASERAWARVVASELAPLATRPLAEIPTGAPARETAAVASEPVAAAPPAPEPAAHVEPEPAVSQPMPPTEGAAPRPPRSRRGGAILLGAVGVAVIAVVVVLLATGGSSSKHKTQTAAKPTTPASSTRTNASRVVAQINLVPTAAGTKTAGIAEVLRQGTATGIAIVAQNVPANHKRPPDAYAVWLYNSPTDSRILGFVNPGVSNNGRLQTAGALPANASHYKQLLVTLENQSNPRSPGKVVLQGALTGV